MTLRRWLLAVGTCSATIAAAEPPLARKSNFDDAKIALAVKGKLAADPMLGSANLFVSVLDGVAAVQGPVADADAIDRVRSTVAAVPGVAAVRVDCHVISSGDPLTNAVKARLDPKPVRVVATDPLPSLPGLPSLAVGPSAGDSNATTARKDDGLPTLPRVIESLPPAPLAPRPYPVIASPNVPIVPTVVSRTEPARPSTANDDEIAFALVDLRSADVRFKSLTATIEAGIVTVRGDGVAAREFVERAKTIPGVRSARLDSQLR
jgi:hypothetical protein